MEGHGMSTGTITRRGLRSYEQYTQDVDSAVQSYCGLSLYDLPEPDVTRYMDSGVSPQAAARDIIKHAHDEGEV
jgi:hypothetical protein